MSIACFAPAEASLAQQATKRTPAKPPPKRTVVALPDTTIISELR
jgi:hypothetical protein